MPSEKITFKGHNGDTLAARLDKPEGPHLATAIFAHCFTCSKDITAARRIATRLAAMGIAVLRFDFTGLGHSDGEFANTSFTSNVEDLIAAATELSERNMPASLLVGHSLGGAAVIAAAPRISGIRAVATLGAPSDPSHVIHQFESYLDTIKRNGSAEVPLAGRSIRIGADFIRDVTQSSLETALTDLDAALLVLHSPTDDVVGIDNAATIFTTARHPKSYITLDDADHLLTKPRDADYAAEVIATWADRYLDLPVPEAPADLPEGTIRVSEVSPSGFLQDIQSGPHIHLYADEPPSLGGTGRGLTPYGLLAAGLGACTTITLRMYARRKGWPLTQARVDVTHEKAHAVDAAADSTPQVDHFERRITLDGPLTDDQRKRLMDIAEKCPVHRTLSRGAVVRTLKG